MPDYLLNFVFNMHYSNFTPPPNDITIYIDFKQTYKNKHRAIVFIIIFLYRSDEFLIKYNTLKILTPTEKIKKATSPIIIDAK